MVAVVRLASPFGPEDPPYDAGPGGRNGSVVRFLRNAKQVRHTRLREVLAWLRETTKVTPEDHRALNALFWSNVNPYGTFRLDLDSRLDLDLAA